MKKILISFVLLVVFFVFSSSVQGAIDPPSAIFSFDIDKNFIGESIWELTLLNLNELKDKELAKSEFNKLMEEYIKLKKECGKSSDYLEKFGEITYAIGNNYIKQNVIDLLKEEEKYIVLFPSYFGGGGPKILYKLKNENYSQCLNQISYEDSLREIPLKSYIDVQPFKKDTKILISVAANLNNPYAENNGAQKSYKNYDDTLIYPINFRSFYEYYFNKNPFIKETEKTSYELKRYLSSFIHNSCNMTGDKYNNLGVYYKMFDYYRYTCNLHVWDKSDIDKLGPFIIVLEKLDSEDVYYSDVVYIPFSKIGSIFWSSNPKPSDNKLMISNLEIKEPNKLIIQFKGAKTYESTNSNDIIDIIKKYYYLFILGLVILLVLIFLILRSKRKNF